MPLPSNLTFLHLIVPITPARATVHQHCTTAHQRMPLPSNLTFLHLIVQNHPSARQCAPLPSNLTFLHLIVPITPACAALQRASAYHCLAI